MGGEVSTDFKSSNGIEISRLVQVLLNFDWFRGSPLGGGRWVDGGGGGERVPPHTYTCTHTHTCMHTHMHMTSYGIPRDSPNGGGHLHEIIMFNTCACACMCTCVGVPPTTPTPIHPPPTPIHPPPPTPRATGSPKHQNSISLELIEII